MLWKRINAKPLVTILLFYVFDKIYVILLYSFARQYQYPQTSTFRPKNKTHFTLKNKLNLSILKVNQASYGEWT